MPTKLNKAGKMQDYIPKGNGDASGEYGTSNGTNKNFTTSDKKKTEANVITENKSVVVENKGKERKEETLPFVDDKSNKANVIGNDSTRSENIEDAYEFTSKGSTKDIKKMVEMMFEAGINPDDENWDKNMVKNAEKLTEEYFDTGKVKLAQKMTKGRSATPRDIMKASLIDMQDSLRMAFANDSFSNWFEKTKEKYKGNTKANVIDGDLTGKKSGYDDSDIRNMDESEFDGVVSTKELWENTTKEYEKAKPILDKMGVKIEDVKFHKDRRTRDDTDNIDELVYQKTGTYSGRTEEEKKAIMSLTEKVYLDKITREFKMPKKTNKIS